MRWLLWEGTVYLISTWVYLQGWRQLLEAGNLVGQSGLVSQSFTTQLPTVCASRSWNVVSLPGWIAEPRQAGELILYSVKPMEQCRGMRERGSTAQTQTYKLKTHAAHLHLKNFSSKNHGMRVLLSPLSEGNTKPHTNSRQFFPRFSSFQLRINIKRKKKAKLLWADCSGLWITCTHR